LRQLKPDLVHTNSLKAALYGGIAARAVGVPVLWHIRDRIEADYLPRTAVHLVRALSRVVPNALIANSYSTLATVPRRYRGIRSVIASPVIYDAVPVSEISARDPSAEIRIAMIGRIAPWKGQDLFIKAFALAFPKAGPTAVIIGGPLFGEDEYEASLHRLVTDLGLEGRVVLTGHVANVAEMRSTCDVAVNASTSPEPFGLVVVEAMAAGIAVVAPNAGGPAEIITHDVSGLLFEPGSASALATALKRLRDDPELRHRLGAAARNRADDFSPTAIANQMLVVYQGVVASGDRDPRRTHNTESRSWIRLSRRRRTRHAASLGNRFRRGAPGGVF
jgi:glycosyltransferase involved in cell wall biosynthesis